jgi:hypothetical protein
LLTYEKPIGSVPFQRIVQLSPPSSADSLHKRFAASIQFRALLGRDGSHPVRAKLHPVPCNRIVSLFRLETITHFRADKRFSTGRGRL